ncbi:hypothetical protein N6G96_07270 [Pediococcus inopinatus]|uniref:Uncharacterized protein n=1 Tax=Pediococcus inopinatus TaxID=114090 RepID=A0ABZ0Q4G2_9LACO|nr:hypothetical protein [Pediococcus inopinatus]WPC21090.1 hypothetical protein N6G96_07270 [Pediococcus inopinatus]
METQLADEKIRQLDNYTLYAANTFMTATRTETSEMANQKYNDLLQNSPYDPNSDKFEKLGLALDEAEDRSSNSFFRKSLDNELIARLVTYHNTDLGTGKNLAQDYPELTGNDMRALKEQKGRDNEMVKEQQLNQREVRSKASTDLRKVYAQAKTNQETAFKSVENLKSYVQMIGSYQQTYKQHYDLGQANVLAAQGLSGKQIVTSSALEKNFISYKGKKQVGAVNVRHKDEHDNFTEHIEPVFDLSDFDKKARAKMATATIDDYKRYSYEEKKAAKDAFYNQDGNHRSFKATGDPKKDLQVAKNRTADYLANVQLGLWKKTTKPNYDKLNFDPSKIEVKEQFEFMNKAFKSSRIITGGVQKQIDEVHQERAKERAENVRKQRQNQPNVGVEKSGSTRVSRVGLDHSNTGVQR